VLLLLLLMLLVLLYAHPDRLTGLLLLQLLLSP